MCASVSPQEGATSPGSVPLTQNMLWFKQKESVVRKRAQEQGTGWRGRAGSSSPAAQGSGTGILSTPSSASLLPDLNQPLHFCCSSTDLPSVIMPEPSKRSAQPGPHINHLPMGKETWGQQGQVPTVCCRTLPPWMLPWGGGLTPITSNQAPWGPCRPTSRSSG